MADFNQHKHRPLEFAALDDRDLECPVCREYNNEEYWTALEHLRESVDTIIWMSGSEDFNPNGGKAGEEWVNRRELLYKALTFLSLSESKSDG